MKHKHEESKFSIAQLEGMIMELGSRHRETVTTCSEKTDNIKTVTTIYYGGANVWDIIIC